jgi:DNA-directed RNA polymerase specialized sigma24 family protein
MRETAAVLGVSYATVWRLIQRGLLKSSTALRRKMIARVEIERFLEGTSRSVF